MNRLLLITSICFSYFVGITAQTTLTHQNHAIKIGDEHHFIITKNENPGPGGADQYWDFSNLEYKKDLVSQMLPPSDFNRSGEIPEANTVIKEFNNKFLFKVKGDIIEQYGVITCGDNVIKYDDPFVKMTFPFSYGDKTEGDFSGVVKNGDNTRVINGFYSLEADAYGTIVLPDDIEVDNVLRLKTVKRRTYGNCGDVTTTTYRWYTDYVRYPLLSIIQQESNNNKRIIRTAYYAELEEALEEAKKKEKKQKRAKELSLTASKEGVTMSVYPNPYENEVNISYKLADESKVILKIIDNTGKLVYNKNLGLQDAGNNIVTLNTDEEGMAAGIYYLKLIVNNTVLTEKIIPVK